MDVLSQRTLMARKEHQCNECLGMIGIGDSYERARIVDWRDAWTWKAHHLCHSVAIEIYREAELMTDEWPAPEEVCCHLQAIFAGLAQLAVAT